tara:strand:+ start:194 stop:406 length:213 start_codon:yes stop_codon:yes gene_type:complete
MFSEDVFFSTNPHPSFPHIKQLQLPRAPPDQSNPLALREALQLSKFGQICLKNDRDRLEKVEKRHTATTP